VFVYVYIKGWRKGLRRIGSTDIKHKVGLVLTTDPSSIDLICREVGKQVVYKNNYGDFHGYLYLTGPYHGQQT